MLIPQGLHDCVWQHVPKKLRSVQAPTKPRCRLMPGCSVALPLSRWKPEQQQGGCFSTTCTVMAQRNWHVTDGPAAGPTSPLESSAFASFPVIVLASARYSNLVLAEQGQVSLLTGWSCQTAATSMNRGIMLLIVRTSETGI